MLRRAKITFSSWTVGLGKCDGCQGFKHAAICEQNGYSGNVPQLKFKGTALNDVVQPAQLLPRQLGSRLPSRRLRPILHDLLSYG